jgi:hypothetical protein
MRSARTILFVLIASAASFTACGVDEFAADDVDTEYGSAVQTVAQKRHERERTYLIHARSRASRIIEMSSDSALLAFGNAVCDNLEELEREEPYYAPTPTLDAAPPTSSPWSGSEADLNEEIEIVHVYSHLESAADDYLCP